MKRRPWSLVILSLFHLLAPVGNIAMNSWLMKISFVNYLVLMWTSENWGRSLFFILIPILSAYCIYSFKKWSYHFYVVLMFSSCIYSFFSRAGYSGELSLVILISFYVLNAAIVGYFMVPSIREIYFNPRLRWWESKPRYAVDFKAEVFQNQKKILAQIKNISEGGFFVEFNEIIHPQQPLVVHFQEQEKQYTINCLPVFQSPRLAFGYGLKIIEEDQQRKKEFHKLVSQYKSHHKLESRLTFTEEDTFVFWLKNLFKAAAWLPRNQR